MKNVSVVIPAHNEEVYISKCIDSINSAAREAVASVEIIVVCNRCTDSTCETAESLGASAIHNDSRCIAAVRNAGIRAAAGPIIITIDADSMMPVSAICEHFQEQILFVRRYVLVLQGRLRNGRRVQ